MGVIDRHNQGEQDQLRLYLDDVFDPQAGGGGGTPSRFIESQFAVIDSAQPLRIGWTRNPDDEHHMCSSGIVRHLAIYSRRLLENDIHQLYLEHPTLHKERLTDLLPAEPATFKHFSEREFGQPGSTSCSAEDIDDLGYPATQAIDDPVSGETTIAFWFYARDFAHNPHALVSKGNAVSSHGGWRFFVAKEGAGHQLVFRVGLKHPTTGQRIAAGTKKPVVPGRWYHVVGVIDRGLPGESNPRDEVRLYLNEELEPQSSGAAGATTRFFPPGATITTPQPLRIGWTRNPDNNEHQCSNGQLTGLRIYKRALSDLDISLLFDAEPPMKSDQVLFDPTRDRFNVDFDSFRIPSLVRTPAGSLLAFTEGRVCSHADYGEINLVYKRSEDEGLTWSALGEVWGGGDDTWGNPTAVADFDTGRVWLFMNWNDADKSQTGGGMACREEEEGPTTKIGKGDRPVYVTWSDDDGLTWAPPRKQLTTHDTAPKVLDLQPTDAAGKPTMSWDAVGPGAGIQIQQGSHAGRLVVPAIGRNIYSDDHGETWHHQVFVSGTSESTIVELSDGNLLRNDRSKKAPWITNQRRWVSRVISDRRERSTSSRRTHTWWIPEWEVRLCSTRPRPGAFCS